MTRGTTPTLIFTLDEFDYSDIAKAELTIRQGTSNVLIKSLDVSANDLHCALSEEESLRIDSGRVKAQIKMMLQDGNVVASNIMDLDVQEILNEEHYGN